MRFSKNIGLAIVSAVSFLDFSNLQAEPLNLDLSLCNGYKRGKISSTLNVYDHSGFLQLSDNFKADDIQLYELGFKGRLAVCDYVVRGEAFWGWGRSGRYVERAQDIESEFSVTKADLKGPRTRDFTLGAGYLFTLGDFLEIIPIGGLSYHFQRFGIHDVETDSEFNEVLNNLHYNTRWQGPWAGVDVGLNFCDINVRGGYEYHWADWHTQWLLDGPNVYGVAFSDMRKSTRAHGQVAFVDARWEFCSCWEIGVGVKWEHWKATHGHLRPKNLHIKHESSSDRSSISSSQLSSSDVPSSSHSVIELDFADVGFDSDETDRIKDAKWDSIRITFDIGCRF